MKVTQLEEQPSFWNMLFTVNKKVVMHQPSKHKIFQILIITIWRKLI